MSLIKCRINANKTVLEVAHSLQISQQAVYQWESGETMPTPSNLVKLSGLYGCTVDDLLRKDAET